MSPVYSRRAPRCPMMAMGMDTEENQQILIQLTTDSNIKGDDALAQQAEAVVRNTLERFSEEITRVSIHLSDENSNKIFGAEE